MKLEEPKKEEREDEEKEETLDIEQIIDKLQGLEDLKYIYSSFRRFHYIGRHARIPIYINHF